MPKKTSKQMKMDNNNNKNIAELTRRLANLRGTRSEESLLHLIGGLIKANEEQYNSEVVNTFIKHTIIEMKKVVDNPEIFEEILVQYINQKEEDRNSQLDTDSEIGRMEFESYKKDIEDIILMFYTYDLVDYKTIKENGLHQYILHTKLFKAMEIGKISKEKVLEFITEAEKENEETKIISLYKASIASSKVKEKKSQIDRNKKMGEKYLSLLSKESMVKLYLNGDIDPKTFSRLDIKEEDILTIDSDLLTQVLKKENVPHMRKMQSKDILGLYMRKLSGKQEIELAEAQKVDEEKIITLVGNGQAEEFDHEKAIKLEEILEFYNGERLLRLANENKINSRFTEILNTKVLAKMPEEKVDEYYKKVISDIRQLEGNNGFWTTRSALELFKKGILTSKSLKENIDSLDEDIETLIVLEPAREKGKAEENKKAAVKLFNEKALSVETLRDIFFANEIMEMYNTGDFSVRALLALPEEDRAIYLDLKLDEHPEEAKSILDLYTKYDGIAIEEVEEILKDKVNSETIYELIDREELSKEKIAELFSRYLISQDELGKFRDEGVISAKDYETFSNALSKAEFFKRLKEQKVITATGVEKGDSSHTGGGKHDGTGQPKKDKISSTTRENVLEKLGGDTKTAVIYGLGKSFNGYSIVGFEDDGLVVFENFEKPSNATYIMTYQQAAYFLENSNIANSAFSNSEKVADLKKSDKIKYTGTKTELRNTENVRRRLHSKHWAKNIAKDLSDLSPNAKARLKPNGKYLENIEKMLLDSKEEYERE